MEVLYPDLWPYIWIGFSIITVAGVLLLLLLTKLYKAKPSELPYVQTPILTEAERRFFDALESAVPERGYLLAQVRLANLVHVKQGSGGFFWKNFSPIGMKCVDFVLCERSSMRPLLVIELDDSSHRRRERAERDKFVDQVLTSVSIPVLHWPVQQTYIQSELVQAINAKLRSNA